jgi:DNA repair protein RecN (Recombination protein N)
MLRRLTVKNLAIVEDLALDLSEGLTVITGETGAGKSILVDALTLVAGGRGSSELVRQGAERLVVSGEFDGDAPLRGVLAEAGLPGGETMLLRREVSSDGRGRAFVEDEPASVRTLARLGELLVAIHGQNSELDLADRGAPLDLLDGFAKADAEREAVAGAAAAWSKARADLEEIEASQRDRTARLELYEFQIREIESVGPSEREEADLAAERGRLSHADKIRLAGETALLALSEGEDSAADRLGEAAKAFAELASIDPREAPHLAESLDLKGRIADLAAAARDAALGIEADPDRLTAIETRLEKIGRLKKKYGPAVADVLAQLAKARAGRDELGDVEGALDRRQKAESSARLAYRRAAAALTAKRQGAAGRFGAAVEKQLQELAMDKARLRLQLEPHPEEVPRHSGQEAGSFLFAPNPGEPEKPIEKIASGGELSRLQLAIRSVGAARNRARRTLVFDEVDAGIGGRVAEVVGRKLRELAARDQVLCVTHVPQIAALADRHFLAEKREVRGRTVAAVRELTGKERVSEIARMLAGEKVPDTALQHARTLLAEAAK